MSVVVVVILFKASDKPCPYIETIQYHSRSTILSTISIVTTSVLLRKTVGSRLYIITDCWVFCLQPPENELQKVGERVPSEHELRVQRSLQRLNVPDWYKNSPAARDGFRLKRHSDASQHGGWRALGSKTTSLSSLSSSSNRQPTTGNY